MPSREAQLRALAVSGIQNILNMMPITSISTCFHCTAVMIVGIATLTLIFVKIVVQESVLPIVEEEPRMYGKKIEPNMVKPIGLLEP